MPDQPIKITRSVGSSWPSRFGPGTSTGGEPTSGDSVAAGIKTVVQSVGGSGNTIAPGPLNTISDVNIVNVKDGDVLRYENNKWRNYNETNLTDGGNF